MNEKSETVAVESRKEVVVVVACNSGKLKLNVDVDVDVCGEAKDHVVGIGENFSRTETATEGAEVA